VIVLLKNTSLVELDVRSIALAIYIEELMSLWLRLLVVH
jgi:hypothetical protein